MDKDHRVRFTGWPQERQEKGKRLALSQRWSYEARARVTHPEYESVIVPCGSCFSALLCAAEVWKVPWDRILKDARVEHCDQSLPVSARPAG